MNYTDLQDTLINRKGEQTELSKNRIAIHNSIRNIVNTRPGTVPGHPQFGTDLDKFLFMPINPLILMDISEEIKYSITRWENRIIFKDIYLSEDMDYNRLSIKISYKIKQDATGSDYSYIMNLDV